MKHSDYDQAMIAASVLAIALATLGTPGVTHAQCRYESPTTPLTDLRGDYQGQTGGLYGGGSNAAPAPLFAEGRSRALDIAPIDGAIVMISVGMSNTTQEFSSFVPMAMAHRDVNPSLVIVDGAQGSEPAQAWIDPSAPTWQEVDRRLTRAGVRPEQVQVAWVKQAVPNPRGAFPEHAETLQGYLEDIARALRANYPNIELAFYSSRTRACTLRSLNPEPYAYESAFSVRWMIEAQQAGERSLDPDSRAPLLAWGPYLWAQATPRSDGFAWPCSSVRTDDCTHPSDPGRSLIAGQLLSFFTTDPLAAPWFLRSGAAPSLDAGMPPTDPEDAGGPARSDSGVSPEPDAGVLPDSSAPPRPIDDDASVMDRPDVGAAAPPGGSAGCAATPPSPGSVPGWLTAALVVALMGARRRRSNRRSMCESLPCERAGGRRVTRRRRPRGDA